MICIDCPRRCAAERSGTAVGVCGTGSNARVCRAMKHMWEEPCISGERGSGAIFFGGCALGCVFCQNHSISHSPAGVEMERRALVDLFKRVEDTGVHNINLVNGTHYTRAIAEALSHYRPIVPVIWNSSGYELPDTLALLRGLVQVYLPDLKFLCAAAARRYARAPDYPERAIAALEAMHRQAGPCIFEAGMLVKGLLVRHLILPGQVTAALRVITHVREALPGAGLSMMAQYVPMGGAAQYPEINRAISQKEYGIVRRAMLTGAPDTAYMQARSAADEGYVPPFGEPSPIVLFY